MARYKITSMTAEQLLEHLRGGATLSSRWVYGRRLNRLSFPDKETLYVQYSNIQALIKARTISSIPLSGDNYEYRLVENS